MKPMFETEHIGPSSHWGRVTHICVSKLTIISLDNGFSSGRRQPIIWTNDGILLIRNLGTNLKRNWYIYIQENAFENVDCEMAAILSRLGVLMTAQNHTRIGLRNTVDCAIYPHHFPGKSSSNCASCTAPVLDIIQVFPTELK